MQLYGTSSQQHGGKVMKPRPAGGPLLDDQISREAHNMILAVRLLGLSLLLKLLLAQLCQAFPANAWRVCRAHLDALQCAGLSMREGFEHMLGGDTKGAQAMQDGLVKASHLCKLWIYVQRIGVAAQPIQRCLVLTSLLLNHRVWSSAAWKIFI